MSWDNTAPDPKLFDGSKFREIKRAVRAVATTNVVIASTGNGASLGGVTLVTGDRVLLAGQSAAAENGIYDVGASALTRSADANASAEFTPGFGVDVTEGTGDGKRYYMTTTGAITLGSTSLAFSDTVTPPTAIAV